MRRKKSSDDVVFRLAEMWKRGEAARAWGLWRRLIRLGRLSGIYSTCARALSNRTSTAVVFQPCVWLTADDWIGPSSLVLLLTQGQTSALPVQYCCQIRTAPLWRLDFPSVRRRKHNGGRLISCSSNYLFHCLPSSSGRTAGLSTRLLQFLCTLITMR